MIQSIGTDILMPLWSEECEKAVVGAILLEREAINIAVDIVTPEMFYGVWDRNIYQACLNLYARNSGIDMLTVKQEIERIGLKDSYGGPMYLMEVIGNVASGVHVSYHCKIISEKFLMRRLHDFGLWMARQSQNPTQDPFQLLDTCEQLVMKLSQQNIKAPINSMAQVMAGSIKSIEENSKRKDGMLGIPSGLRDLDAITLGFQKKDLILIAARPSMGKTVMGINCAINAAKYIKLELKSTHKVYVVSIEMPNDKIGQRMISGIAEIPSMAISTGRLNSEQWASVVKASQYISELPLVMDEDQSITISQIKSKARKISAEYGIAMIVIDYLQIVKIDSSRRFNNREQEVAHISSELKSLAKELNIPVIALAQVNRSVNSRNDKKPQLSDLRESAALEMDADIVIFPHRPEYYGIHEDETGSSTAGIGYAIVAKNRNGATGEARLQFLKDYSKFDNIGEYNGIQAIDSPKPNFQPSTRFDYKSKQSNDDILGSDDAPF
jgi:replicative DNA helicase